MARDYFAALPTNQIGDELLERKDEYYRYLEETGRATLLHRAYETYHRPALKKGQIWRLGRQGEYTWICVNDFRNLIQHRLSMTTNQRPHFEPKAANTDFKSQAQVILARGLLEYYNRIKKMERFTAKATENAIVYGEGFIFSGWNPTKGEEFTKNPETGQPVFEGDLEFEVFTTFDVIRPVENKNNESPDWVMIRRFANKYDLAAKYEELEDKIVDLNIEERGETGATIHTDFVHRWNENKENTLIPVYTFFHRRSEALPEGRIVEFSDSDIIYHDGPLPYRNIPLYRIAPSEHEGRIFGYTNSFDMMPIQEALDKLYSTVLSNQAAFGVQNIAIPKGSGIGVSQVAGGLNIIEFDAKLGPPQPLNLTQTPAEIFNFITQLKQDMETIVGVNSVARGNPEQNLKSGSALALVQSMAIQFAQTLQQSYIQLLEDLGTGLIEILQDYATVPRVALIAGKANRSYLKEFKAEDIAEISRVVVDVGNPLNRTLAGRVNLAEQLLQNQMIQTPQQFIEVLSSGRIEPVIESEQAELMLIRAENEDLQEGKPVQALRTDNHQLHIAEHLTVLSSPEARRDPPLVQSILAHVEQHEFFLSPPLPEQVAGANADQSQLAETEEGNIPQQLNATNPVTQQAGTVEQPDQPINPLTGGRFNPETGG